MKFIVSIFSVVFIFLFSLNAMAADNVERNLYEKMLDTSALTKSGISYKDYEKITQDLVVSYSRYERAGLKKGKAGYYLERANLNFMLAKDIWTDLLDTKSQLREKTTDTLLRLEDIQSQRLNGAWERANQALSDYGKLKRK